MFSDLDIGMDIWYRTDSSVFNLRRIQSKDQGEDWYCQQCRQVLSGLWQLWPNHQYKKDRSDAPTNTCKTICWAIHDYQRTMKVVEKFTSHGSTLFKSTVTNDEMNARLTKASAALANSTGMCGIGEESRRLPKSRYTKLSFLPLFFMAMKQTTYQQHIKKLNHFRMTCLRKILGITCQTVWGQVLPWKPKKALQRHTESFCELFRYDP